MDLADGTAWAGVLAQVASGWLVADLITALVHLTLDKLWGTRCQHWPFVGRIIREFHEHHDSPQTHAGHHNGHFDRNFGILNGWSNPLLNPVLAMGERLFRRGKLP